MLKKLYQKLGVDRAILWTLLTQAIRFITGPITMFLMVRYLTPEIQGYAYTFSSVLGLGIFLEMGFSQNILQFASHEFSKLELDSHKRLKGDDTALSRLVSLGRLSFKYFGIASVVFGVALLIGGTWFFESSESTDVSWESPWIIACITAAAGLFMCPCWALLEGCNQIAPVERFRFYSSLAGFLVTSIAMILGLGLYALIIPSVFSLVVSVIYLFYRWRHFFSVFLKAPSGETISWKKEIWPFQWRIAISWASGYFIFTFITPVVFRMAGPAEAGRFGFTMQLVRTVAAISSSWSVTKLPLYGMLVARKDFPQLQQLWKKITNISLIVAALGSIGMIASMEIGIYLYPELAKRYSGAGTAAVLCLAMLVQTATSSFAYYLRAFKEEPYMMLSVYNALLSALLIPLFTFYWQTLGAAWGYTLAILILFFPAYFVFKKKRADFTVC